MILIILFYCFIYTYVNVTIKETMHLNLPCQILTGLSQSSKKAILPLFYRCITDNFHISLLRN